LHFGQRRQKLFPAQLQYPMTAETHRSINSFDSLMPAQCSVAFFLKVAKVRLLFGLWSAEDQ
jgi:hypothetical protein